MIALIPALSIIGITYALSCEYLMSRRMKLANKRADRAELDAQISRGHADFYRTEYLALLDQRTAHHAKLSAWGKLGAGVTNAKRSPK